MRGSNANGFALQWNIGLSYRDTTWSTVAIRVNIFQNELLVKIYSKSLVVAIGKVLCMEFS